ncbi:MAG: hypothetical protein HDT04_01360 [Bacteroidales bacterium]|nr:hypothetical protein [Bacteroidales bacterium]
MNKRNMGIILIVAGATLLVCGIIMVSTNKPNGVEPANTQPHVVIVEKHVDDTIISPTAVENSVSRPLVAENTTIDESKAKGDAFEDFVINLLADWRLKLLDRTQDAVSTAGVIAESCKNPDLHIQQKRGKGEIDYYLECKYRSQWKDGAVTFEDWQLDRYRQFQRDNRRKVIFALGVGGTPSAPASFMLVPLDSVKGNSIKQIKTEFAVEPSSSALVEYMNNYFSKVFSKAKNKS